MTVKNTIPSILFTCLIIGMMFTNSASATTIRTNFVSDGAREQYPLDLLRAAFKHLPNEDLTFSHHHENVNQARMFSMLTDSEIDLIWVGTRPDLEVDFLPIRVPLFKGLLGHRIFIIRNGEQSKFSAIDSFQDLLQLKAGQGRFWGDTKILESAGIPVVKPVNYPNLFDMLDGERFDYFPRAVHEPWPEVTRNQHLDLAIEKDLMLIYPMPLYFFTNKNNKALAQKIETGLMEIVKSGEFDTIFFENEDIKTALDQANIANRRVYRIDNPTLSAATPINDKRLWFDIESL